jgi:DNA helicase-2/ATP-dependent DNA helicase PcrA
MAEQIVVLGPPGTGKTHRLMEIMEKELNDGILPSRIAFVSFTKRAAGEAARRAMEKFDLDEKDLPYFRTLHSLAFRELGMVRTKVFNNIHRAKVGAALGLRFSRGKESADEGGLPSGYYTGDRYAFIDGYSRARKLTAEQVWDELGGDDINWLEYKKYLRTLAEYKGDHGLYEFPDMIDNYVKQQLNLDVDVAIIDEAQDLSSIQWDMVECAFRGAQRVYVAGDDDQAIFQWSGADVQKFLHLPGKQVVLHQTHRYGPAIHKLAESVIKRASERYDKKYSPKQIPSTVDYHSSIQTVDIRSGEWFLLARNSYHLPALEAYARGLGVAYTRGGESVINPTYVRAIQLWEAMRKGRPLQPSEMTTVKQYLPLRTEPDDCKHLIWHEAFARMPLTERVFYVSLLKAGQSLTKEPKVHISTIHGVKGGEAENVLLTTDVTERTFAGMQTNYDAEVRCFYVGITRARSNLHVVLPQSRKAFEI